MQVEALGLMFREIQRITATQMDPHASWTRVLEITGQTGDPQLVSVDMGMESRAVARQMREILAQQPLPSGVTFLYFGLFDPMSEKGKRMSAGYYVAAGAAGNCEEALRRGDLKYLPENRFIESAVLSSVRESACEESSRKDILGYAVLFGAAAILAKEAVISIGLHLPVYVGFDSGDFAVILER